MKLNREANQIRNLNLSDDRKLDFDIKKEFLEILKNKTWYKKDEEKSKSKKERRKHIRDLAWQDEEKIIELRNVLYTQEEKDEEKHSCPFPRHKGYYDVWSTLTDEEKKLMRENIRITKDWKIEMIKIFLS